MWKLHCYHGWEAGIFMYCFGSGSGREKDFDHRGIDQAGRESFIPFKRPSLKRMPYSADIARRV
jgi:hypothetical protein